MAASPVSQPTSVPPPLPSTPVTDPILPPAESPPPPDLSAPPPVIASPEPPVVVAPPPIVTSLPPPALPPPVVSSPPETSQPPPLPTPEISPPPPVPQANEPPPSVIVPQSPPSPTSFPPPENSVNETPPPSPSSPSSATPTNTLPPPSPSSPSSATPTNTLPPPSPSSPSSATPTNTLPPPSSPAHTSPPSPSSPAQSSSSPHLAPPTPPNNPKHTWSPPTTLTPSAQDGNARGGNAQGGVQTGIVTGVVAAFVVIGFFMVICCLRRRRKRHDKYNSVYMLPSQFASSQLPTPQFPSSQESGSSFVKQNHSVGGGGDYMNSTGDSGIIANSQTWFSYEQLNIATNGYASQNILGVGGFGCVYKGILADGQVVAVKKLKDVSGQGDREFKAEVETVSRVHHRYLVSLVGYCISDNNRLLVYEYVANNTLQHHIHGTNKPVMQWSLRVKAACGSARGLAYLHEDCHPKIIHRDIKTANILLDSNFDAKVADFGLAKLAGELELNTHVSTRVMGTFGYMAPEYAASGKLTEKSDVFSFGVVLLELITGRKPVDESMPLGDESLVEWARPLMTEALESQDFSELADQRLEGNYDMGEMFRMIEAAAACVRHSASKRPKMSQVVRALDTMNELSDISNGMKPGQSGIFNSREQSAQIKMFQRMAFGSQDFSSSEHSNTQSSWKSGQAGGASGMV